MMDKTRKIQVRKSQGLKIIIFAVILLTAFQGWFLLNYYKELITKIPSDLFKAPKEFPLSEQIINEQITQINISENNLNTSTTESSVQTNETETTASESTAESSSGSNAVVLSDIQKKIVLKLMELLDQNITYGYKVYPETGYPTENDVWASTDVIAITLRDIGYDLMDLINIDMKAHKEDYPMDISKRKNPIKYIDFRDVFFQEKFFSRNALELQNKDGSWDYISGNEDNPIQWQPGDLVYFQFDPKNPYQDLGGFISSHTNANGVPLIIMISKEFGSVKEVDKLLEYKVVGHYRYPNPYTQ
jgi:uncharacterized protein YijF (DUF1287 family)